MAETAEALTDPVCGMTVTPDSPHHATHAAQDFWFCSARCRERFVADPMTFLEPSDSPPVAIPGAV